MSGARPLGPRPGRSFPRSSKVENSKKRPAIRYLTYGIPHPLLNRASRCLLLLASSSPIETAMPDASCASIARVFALALASALAGTQAVSGHHQHLHRHAFSLPLESVVALPTLSINSVPIAVREGWMRRANAAVVELASPCTFSPFASVIVNHTASVAGELVCIGVNSNVNTGDPVLHGEIAAIQNCTAVMTDPSGPYKFTPKQAQAAFADLSLYTNAESCPMCASAIRWAGFREYIYGTSIATLIEQGWGQIRIPSIEVFERSFDLPNPSRLLAGVLANETDPLFSWQFDPSAPCPAGCARVGTTCRALAAAGKV
ncbi:cytidine deaminase-like protein [Cubamyces lactineus]|nr:cytidine deaminase-like protein [Cubamyces lactineus]